MEELFKVINLNIEDKIGNLKAEAHSSVKSTKYFPIYMIDGKKMIFKPLSKTKPLTTPLFAYSEVYWSYIISKYFDSKTPRYYLAKALDTEREQPKYFNQGVLVESITLNDEKLINLYDYFNEYKEEKVDIRDYINYCMQNYDYTKILLSSFIKENKEIGEGLAYQILLSILRQDQNFHYENVNFIYKEKLVLAPPIDFEFSTPFLYPDNKAKYNYEKEKYIKSLEIKNEEDDMDKILGEIKLKLGFDLCGILTKNICLIVKMYPGVVLKFIKNIDKLVDELPEIIINDPDNYIGCVNSDYWEAGHALFKDNDLEGYKQLKETIKLGPINKEEIFNRISTDVLSFSMFFRLLLKIYLFSYYNGIDNLENLTIKQLLNKLNIEDDVIIEDIDVNIKELKLSKRKI